MKKIIAFGVIVLFVGMGFQPAFANIMENNPPYVPSDPIPPDGATNWTGGGLCWTGGDPDGDSVTYDVYFGNISPPSQIGWNQTSNCTFIMDIEFNTTYYWKIVAWDEHGASTPGPIWHFTTEQNYPPNPAENPIPFDGDPCVPSEGLILKWNGSDPNFGDTLRYDLYFDDVNPPLTQRVWEGYKDEWEVPFTLPKYKTYYWRVDTYDKMDESTEGYVWSFSTNCFPPSDPIIDGPYHGVKNQEYEFTFVSVNPDNDSSIQYHVKWDDGTENLTEFYPSGEVVTLSHSWSYDGEKVIQARAIDKYGLMSDWSTWTIVIPRDKSSNLGLNNVEDCDCQTFVPDIKEIFKLLNYEIVNNRVYDNFGYCLILYIQTAISVYLAEIFHFISQEYPEDSILYKILNNLCYYYMNRFYRLIDIGKDNDCWWIPDPPPDP